VKAIHEGGAILLTLRYEFRVPNLSCLSLNGKCTLPKSRKITFHSKESCANIQGPKEFGYKNRNLGEFFRVRGPRNFFWIAVVKAAA
jgi:hypothetical protein